MDHTPRIRPEALRALRWAKRLSVADLAEAAGIDASAIYRIEKGERVAPRMVTLSRLADALGVGIEELVVHAEEEVA